MFMLKLGEELLDTIKQKILSPTILWQNSNPTSDFPGQVITLNSRLDNYIYYSILYKFYKGDGQVNNSGLIPIQYGTKTTTSWEMCCARNINEPSQYRDGGNEMHISDGVKISSFYANTADNSRAIPVIVYGWK